MIVSKIVQRMIDFSAGNLHDINHFMKVWAYAKTIGKAEKLDKEKQIILLTPIKVHIPKRILLIPVTACL